MSAHEPVGTLRPGLMTGIGRTALVVGACLGGTVALVGLFIISGDGDFGATVALFGPFALGCVVALCARGRATGLMLALVVFAGIGVATALVATAVGSSDFLAEGGTLVIFWVTGTEVLGLYATAGVWSVIRRTRARSDFMPGRFDTSES
jgi:hypothetical protein